MLGEWVGFRGGEAGRSRGMNRVRVASLVSRTTAILKRRLSYTAGSEPSIVAITRVHFRYISFISQRYCDCYGYLWSPWPICVLIYLPFFCIAAHANCTPMMMMVVVIITALSIAINVCYWTPGGRFPLLLLLFVIICSALLLLFLDLDLMWA